MAFARRIVRVSSCNQLHKRLYSYGLFGRHVLSSPEGFNQVTKDTITEANKIANEIVRSVDPTTTVDLFDELSNTLCRTADLAECIRLLHPNKQYVQQAQSCCLQLSSFVEKLNTNKGLYIALKAVVNSTKYDHLEEDTKRNASSLMHDFEISGIHLSDGERERVVTLHEAMLSMGHTFMSNCTLPSLIKKTNLPLEFNDYFNQNGEHIVIDHTPYMCKENIRELSYRIYYSSPAPQSQLLDKLLLTRYKLASTVGYKSFAHRTLKDSMAGSPEVVLEFLNLLNNKLRPLVEEETMEALKYQTSGGNQLLPWNVPWITQKAKQQYIHNSLQQDDMMKFFSLTSCMQGVDLLFSSLFGVNLKEETCNEGEVWHDSVKKYSFITTETNQTIGQLFCDFHHRPTKLQSDCQFTIQGCRKLQDDSYQMPISVLNLSLPHGMSSCLSQLAVENLFHEMGHAAHSVLGRTRYQNVSGTRCPTDFAEVPSNLMELFLHDERILKSFAKRNSTGKIISDKYSATFRQTSNIFPALSAQTQILYSVMDQIFHSTFPLNKSTVEIFADLHQTYSPFIRYIPGTAYFLRFPHLTTYAGKYYSYLWSRAVANLIWQKCFKNDPFSPNMGRLYKEKMLAFGGGESPNRLVENLLGYQPTIRELVDSYYQEIVELKEKR